MRLIKPLFILKPFKACQISYFLNCDYAILYPPPNPRPVPSKKSRQVGVVSNADET